MKYQKFEQHISESLRNEKAELDIDALILDIHGQKPKRRIAGYWWALLSILLISGGIWLFFPTKSAIHKEMISENNLVSANHLENNSESIIDKSTINTSKFSNTTEEVKNSNNNSEPNNSRLPSAIVKSNKNQSKAKESLIQASEKITQNQLKAEETLHQTEESSNTKSSHLEIIPFLDQWDFSPLHFNRNQSINPRKVICPDFRKKMKFDIALSPEAGAFLPLKSLENKGSEPNNVYNLRSQNEKPLEGIYAGLFAQVSTPKLPIYLKAGISWSRLTEKMNLKYSYTKKDTTQGIISITYSQTGDTITAIIGDIITERRLSGSKTRHHQFQLWDIPVGIGYEQALGNWYASIEAGVNINLSTRSSGSILQSDTSFTHVNLPTEYFKKQLGLSYFAGAQIGRWVHTHGRLYVSTRFRMIPNAFSTDNNNAVQKYHFLGLNLGYSRFF